MIQLRDEHRERIRERFPEKNIPDGRPGRKRNPTRRALEARLWIRNTGAQWRMLPQRYPNCETVHRRFQSWCRNEVLRNRLTDLANTLRDEGSLDETESSIDATFSWAKGGGEGIGPTKRVKGASVVHVAERRSQPGWIGGRMSQDFGNGTRAS